MTHKFRWTLLSSCLPHTPWLMLNTTYGGAAFPMLSGFLKGWTLRSSTSLASCLPLMFRYILNLFFFSFFPFLVCCKVEFNQPSCWLYSVPNLLVIQHLQTLYLGGNHVRLICKRVWRKTQDYALSKGLVTGSRGLQVTKGCTRVKHAEELNSHAC